MVRVKSATYTHIVGTCACIWTRRGFGTAKAAAEKSRQSRPVRFGSRDSFGSLSARTAIKDTRATIPRGF